MTLREFSELLRAELVAHPEKADLEIIKLDEWGYYLYQETDNFKIIDGFLTEGGEILLPEAVNYTANNYKKIIERKDFVEL